MNQLDYEYRFKFNKTCLKLSKYERLLNAKVYKEFVIDNNCYLIIKRPHWKYKTFRYICKHWTGKVWRYIGGRNNPRMAINLIKKHVNYMT